MEVFKSGYKIQKALCTYVLEMRTYLCTTMLWYISLTRIKGQLGSHPQAMVQPALSPSGSYDEVVQKGTTEHQTVGRGWVVWFIRKNRKKPSLDGGGAEDTKEVPGCKSLYSAHRQKVRGCANTPICRCFVRQASHCQEIPSVVFLHLQFSSRLILTYLQFTQLSLFRPLPFVPLFFGPNGLLTSALLRHCLLPACAFTPEGKELNSKENSLSSC